MGFDTIIANGRVVTATDTYAATLPSARQDCRAVGQSTAAAKTRRKIIDAAGSTFFLAASMCIRTSTCPLAGTTSADDFETGTRAAAFGGTTTLIDFAIQYKGQTLANGF